MPSINDIRDFFYANPAKIGMQKLSSSEILEIMTNTSTTNSTSPYAENIGRLLSNDLKESSLSHKVDVPEKC